MSNGRTAEPAINAAFANVLRTMHPRWGGRIGVEQTGVFRDNQAYQPDIVVYGEEFSATPVVIETEIYPARTVEKDAKDRIGQNLIRTGKSIEHTIAVKVPKRLRTIITSQEDEILKSEFHYCTFSLSLSGGIVRWPENGWLSGSVGDIASCIEQLSFSESLLIQTTSILEEGVSRSAEILHKNNEVVENKIAEILQQESNLQTSRMAMAIIANALIFYIQIEGTDEGILTLDELRGEQGLVSKTKVLDSWKYVLDYINYWPIFDLASKILTPIPSNQTKSILTVLANVGVELSSLGATSMNDLSGRMFQRLITDRKFLATFYTLPFSAALLAELAVNRLNIKWNKIEEVSSLKIADFACGTGTLIGAAYQQMQSRIRRAGLDDSEHHAELIQNVFYACDIMPAATHLTTSTLSGANPGVPFKNTKILTLPYGERGTLDIKLGALDLIEETRTVTLFDLGAQQFKGSSETTEMAEYLVKISHKSMDVAIMNPPFTRPTNHEASEVPIPSFAGFNTKDDEQKAMSIRLREILSKQKNPASHGNAGLASNFIDLAHNKLKNGGIVALVLPFSFVSGKAWKNARNLILNSYKKITIVSIAANNTNERSFSADTSMAEVLLIATKKMKTEDICEPILFVNLYKRPQSQVEAIVIAKSIDQIPVDKKMGVLKIGDETSSGVYIKMSEFEGGCSGIRNVELAKFMSKVIKNNTINFSRSKEKYTKLNLAQLKLLGERGLLARDINGDNERGPFDVISLQPGTVPTWPMLWRHDSKKERKMIVEIDRQGEIRPNCDTKAKDVWLKSASLFHICIDFRLNSQSLAACITPELCIGGNAWPSHKLFKSSWNYPIVLWMNSTLGLMTFWWLANRQSSGRARMSLSLHPNIPVLDTRALSNEKLEQAKNIFYKFKNKKFLIAHEAWKDDTRIALDQAILVDLLNYPQSIMRELELIRKSWCSEPTVHGGKLGSNFI